MDLGYQTSQWIRCLDEFMQRIGALLPRKQVRDQAARYLRGLLASIERKNGWQIAEAVGDAAPYSLQHFLGRGVWDTDRVRDDLQRYAVEHFGDPDGILVVDETGFIKKGDKSAGVQRQYSGTAGRIENCQIGVFLGYATRHGATLIDRRLYLPQSWSNDRVRCRASEIPDEIAFTTKPKLGIAMLAHALQAGVPARWVVGDSVYGSDSALRSWLEERRLGYVLAVTGQHPVRSMMEYSRADEWAATVPAREWQRLSAGEGSKGQRMYAWTWRPLGLETDGWCRKLLARRSLSKPDETAYYVVHMPVGTSLTQIVRIAGSRWHIESLFQATKNEVGLDDYEVRSWQGWHRHITLAMFAHAYLTTVRKSAAKKKITTPTCSRSPFPRSVASSLRSSTTIVPISAQCWHGHIGAAIISNARYEHIGKPMSDNASTYNCSTRAVLIPR
jgi:SRSO17 transposase